MESEREKKIALVTGSGSGIGANIAIDLVNEGYHVIVTGRTMAKLQEVVNQCRSNSVTAFVVDFFQVEQIDELLNFIDVRFKKIDVLVNNACYRGEVKSILGENSYDDLCKVLHLNLSVPLYLIHRLFKQQGPSSSVVLNISSIASTRVVPLHLYSISKACLSELSSQLSLLRDELGLLSVTVSPGPVLTEERPHHEEMSHQTMMRRVGTTQEISNLAIFAIKQAHLFNGKELFVDGGLLAKAVS